MNLNKAVELMQNSQPLQLKPECDHLYAAMEWETDEEWAYEEKQCEVSTVTKIFCQKCLTKRDL